MLAHVSRTQARVRKSSHFAHKSGSGPRAHIFSGASVPSAERKQEIARLALGMDGSGIDFEKCVFCRMLVKAKNVYAIFWTKGAGGPF